MILYLLVDLNSKVTLFCSAPAVMELRLKKVLLLLLSIWGYCLNNVFQSSGVFPLFLITMVYQVSVVWDSLQELYKN